MLFSNKEHAYQKLLLKEKEEVEADKYDFELNTNLLKGRSNLLKQSLENDQKVLEESLTALKENLVDTVNKAKSTIELLKESINVLKSTSVQSFEISKSVTVIRSGKYID